MGMVIKQLYFLKKKRRKIKKMDKKVTENKNR